MQLLAIACLFVATKILEISYFDMQFCIVNLGHQRYKEREILEIEDQIASLTAWHFTQSTQYDIHQILIGMVKVRLPPMISTVLYKTVMFELDQKFLIEVRLSLCIKGLQSMRPLDKLAGMLTFKLWRLVDFIQKDFPTESAMEILTLNQIWQHLIQAKLAMRHDDLWRVGEAAYQEIHAYRAEVKNSCANALEELQRITT